MSAIYGSVRVDEVAVVENLGSRILHDVGREDRVELSPGALAEQPVEGVFQGCELNDCSCPCFRRCRNWIRDIARLQAARVNLDYQRQKRTALLIYRAPHSL